MKALRFTDGQIIAILKQNEGGGSVAALCREQGISQATLYKWRRKYGSMDLALMRRLKELEAENARLNGIYAEDRIKSDLRQEALEGIPQRTQ
jgi:putative transposase